MEKVELLRQWYQRVWIEGDPNAIDEMFTPDTHAAGVMSDFEVGPEDFKVLVPALMSKMRDTEVVFDKTVEHEDWLWTHVTIKAKGAETLQPFSFSGQVMCRVKDDKILEAYNHFDMISFFEGIGALPMHTVPLLFGGETLG